MKRIVCLMLLIACGPPPEKARMPASGTMMAGDSMAMMASALVAAEQARLDSAAAGDTAALAHHAAAVPVLIKAIQTDLMHMGMHRDSAYDALIDSVRRDPGDLARVRRMLGGYTAMAAKGKRG